MLDKIKILVKFVAFTVDYNLGMGTTSINFKKTKIVQINLLRLNQMLYACDCHTTG